jgi:hypothetical protein
MVICLSNCEDLAELSGRVCSLCTPDMGMD